MWKTKTHKKVTTASGWPSECSPRVIEAKATFGNESGRGFISKTVKDPDRSDQLPHIGSALGIALDDVIPTNSSLDFTVDYLEELLGRQPPVQMAKGRH